MEIDKEGKVQREESFSNTRTNGSDMKNIVKNDIWTGRKEEIMTEE